MKKLVFLILLCSFAVGLGLRANPKKEKHPPLVTVFLQKKKTSKGIRSIVRPLIATIDPTCTRMELNSPDESGMALVTVIGNNGQSLTDMIDFSNLTAMLDVSELDCGAYTITVEFENGAIYIGLFEFI